VSGRVAEKRQGTGRPSSAGFGDQRSATYSAPLLEHPAVRRVEVGDQDVGVHPATSGGPVAAPAVLGGQPLTMRRRL